MELKVTVWLCREHVQQLTEHASKHGDLNFDFTVGSGVCYSADHGDEEVPAVCAARLVVEPVGWTRRQLAARLESVAIAPQPVAVAPQPVIAAPQPVAVAAETIAVVTEPALAEEPVKKETKSRSTSAGKAPRPKRAAVLTSEDSDQKYVVCPHCSQIHWIGSENADPEELVCACQKKILVKAK